MNVTVSLAGVEVEIGFAGAVFCTFAEPQLMPNNGKLEIVIAARNSFISYLSLQTRCCPGRSWLPDQNAAVASSTRPSVTFCVSMRRSSSIGTATSLICVSAESAPA